MRFQVKSGVTRSAVIIGAWVFKFPSLRSWKMFLQGLLGNMQEREWSGFSPRLCPVKFALWGGFLNVMPYAQPLSDAEWATLDKVTFNQVRRGPDGTYLPVEHKRDSFGWLEDAEGEPVLTIVDYGN